MTRPKIGKCEGCGRRRPIRRVGVQDGRDVYRCGDCVPWGKGVAAIDHEVISADEDGLIADGGERVDGEVTQPAISAVVWVDDDGQRYKRVWDDGPKDIPISGGDRA